MQMQKKVLKSKPITVDDYYSQRFLKIETELSHQRELMKIGFDTMNKRFEAMREDINRRFEAIDKKIDAVTSRIDKFMYWSFGMTVTSTGLIIAAMKYWR